METVIDIQNLCRQFGKQMVLDDVSFCLKRGDVFGYLGPNGAGKTTTIRILLGLIRPTKGQAKILGEDVTQLSASTKRSLGAVLENSGLYNRLSAWDNLYYYGRIYRLSKAECEARIREVLSLVGLWPIDHQAVGQFSLGMKRRLSSARVLLHDPELLLLDEPTLGLDPEGTVAIRQLILNLSQEQGCTILLTSHHLDMVEQVCTQIGILTRGKIRLVGETKELCRQESLEKVYLSTLERYKNAI